MHFYALVPNYAGLQYRVSMYSYQLKASTAARSCSEFWQLCLAIVPHTPS